MQLLHQFILPLAVWSSLTSISMARGGMDGGGGELLQDSQNPWFIQNTDVVHYCTVYDLEHYHQTPEVSQALLEKAIRFWQEEFKSGQSIFSPRIEVATQRFVRTECSGPDVDIVFQFGFLDAKQRVTVSNLSRFAAFSVRTEYDPIRLRGKGFVYIAADSGADKFGDQSTVESPWTYNDAGLLYWTMVHELGHIFGLSHTNQIGGFNVMASEFIETVTSKTFSRMYRLDLVVNNVFHVRHFAQNSCRSDPMNRLAHLKKFFGIDPSSKCFGIQVTTDGLKVYTRTADPNSENVLVGTADNDKLQGSVRGFTLVRDALHFWLPPEQKNLPREQQIFPDAIHIFTPSYFVEDIVATYKNVNGTIIRKMSYTLDPRNDSPAEDFKMGGFMDGTLYVNLIEGT